MGEQWIVNMESLRKSVDRVKDKKRWRNRSIYRVPKVLRDIHNKAYIPQIASFGPYHYGLDHLMPMEPLKRRALFLFLQRTNKSLADVVIAMRKKVRKLRESYDELDGRWKDDNRFLELMILDGCFMLHLVHEEYSEVFRDTTDPIFGKPYILNKLRLDMLRIENQLPLRVLSILSDVAGHQMEEIIRRVQLFIRGPSEENEISQCCITRPSEENESMQPLITGSSEEKEILTGSSSSLHVLDLYRKGMILKKGYTYTTTHNIRYATELHKSGVQFKKSTTKCYNDISFDGGVLYLPAIRVNDTTEHILLNLITFEQLHAAGNYEVMSYVFFMVDLIDRDQDVALLHKNRIIEGMLGSDQEIASLFNRIGKEIWMGRKVVPNTNDVNKQLRYFCDRSWPRLRASFRQTYLINPWVFFSLLGALLLLALTIQQSVYSVLSFYNY